MGDSAQLMISAHLPRIFSRSSRYEISRADSHFELIDRSVALAILLQRRRHFSYLPLPFTPYMANSRVYNRAVSLRLIIFYHYIFAD